MAGVILEDTFEIKAIDPQGKKFPKVSRVQGQSMTHGIELILDVNTELYPLTSLSKFTLVISSSLHDDGRPDTGMFEHGALPPFADKYDYIMHGKVYRIEDEGKDGSPQLAVYMSFGGLLMRLKGEPRTLQKPNLDVDSSHYLLIRKD